MFFKRFRSHYANDSWRMTHNIIMTNREEAFDYSFLLFNGVHLRPIYHREQVMSNNTRAVTDPIHPRQE